MTLEEKAAQLVTPRRAIPRLGIPAYNWWNEGLHGVRAPASPPCSRRPSAWPPPGTPLMHEVGDVITTEFRAKYARSVRANGGTDWYRGLTVWSPNINIFRDPRWGRGQETYGEDPFLSPHGRRLRQRTAGRRSEVPQGHRHAQAFRGAQRAGVHGTPPTSTSRRMI